jgi:hypothetical protein
MATWRTEKLMEGEVKMDVMEYVVRMRGGYKWLRIVSSGRIWC